MPKSMLADVADGQAIRTLAYLKAKKLIPYKNKTGSFLALTLVDRSGTLEGKIFENAEEIAAGLTEGQIITISGRASTYNGVLGLVLDAAAAWEGSVDRADFMPACEGDIAALQARLQALLDSLTDPDLASLVQSIFEEPCIRQAFEEAPAAKEMHGAYLHGLLEHVVRQAELAEAACRVYPQANRDLVIAGVLLHDIGKTQEFSWDLGIDYTVPGRLLSHMAIADHLICTRGRELNLPEAKTVELRHLILSHHGTREFGALVLPQTLEAIVLHCVDYLEAKATRCITMTKDADPWSEYDRIEGHYWYRGEGSRETVG